MKWNRCRWAFMVVMALSSSAVGYAQEATLSGTITDATGGVLPGVTVTAVHEATGNTFTTISNELGDIRLPLRVGGYRVTAELSGFATLTLRLEVLVGQQAVVNLQMSPSALQETVTVTGEAPLLDVTQSSLGGNIDSRQVSDLPVNGRNFLDLTLLAPGNRTNAVGGNDEILRRSSGNFQLNVDGQQVTNMIAFNQGQPRFSRDAIAEFEFVSNRFDATQGRSAGVQVNVVTKSGTNTLSGSFSGYLRDDKFNAADFIQNRVLPYSNQQLSGTIGGPIVRDKLHYFVAHEYERHPQTFTYSSPFPAFNIDQTGTTRRLAPMGRLDWELPAQNRLTLRAAASEAASPYEADPRVTGGASIHPSASNSTNRHSSEAHASLTTLLTNRSVNELKIGYSSFSWDKKPVTRWNDSPTGTGLGAPQISFQGYRIGQGTTNVPLRIGADNYSIRNDYSYAAGRHTLKVGGDYLYHLNWMFLCPNRVGTIDARGGPIPANIQQLFPVWNDVSTWNLNALNPLVRSYSRTVGTCGVSVARHVFATWLQDDWRITSRVTLNLGVRYDVATGVFAQDLSLPPFLEAGRPNDTNNVAPRLGFSFQPNDQTVVRGGFGTYFAEVDDTRAFWPRVWAQQAQILVLNDGRPDFLTNPFNGPIPTYEEAVRSARRSLSSLPAPNAQVPYSYQTSVGVQRQVGTDMAVQADFVFTGTRHDAVTMNINLAYDPITGVNYPFTDIRRLPFPEFGIVQMSVTTGRSNYHGLQTAFTKRLSNRWQAQATYTLSGLWDEDAIPYSGLRPVSAQVPRDLGGEYSLAETDQRHRAVLNGIWDLGRGFQLSGLYFFGSGERFATTYGADLRLTGVTPGAGSPHTGRLRPDGTIVPRNNFVGKPIHRVDLRLQQRLRLGGRAYVDGMLEAFNLFNHENFGSYVTTEVARNYRAPSENPSLAYQSRMLQLGFRLAF